jgi:hypothetical protein
MAVALVTTAFKDWCDLLFKECNAFVDPRLLRYNFVGVCNRRKSDHCNQETRNLSERRNQKPDRCPSLTLRVT